MRPLRPVRALRSMLAIFVAGLASLAGVASVAQASATTKRILVLPPLQWDAMGVASHIAVQQSAGDLARLMGGLTFGLKPEEVSKRLARSGGELHWSDLPASKQFAEDVRFVRMPIQDSGTLRSPIAACFGESSYVVLLFRNNALFRVSWRFLPGQNCPNPHDAAEELYAAYVPIATTIAVSAHYRAGSVELVDVTDPGAGPLIGQRWKVGDQ